MSAHRAPPHRRSYRNIRITAKGKAILAAIDRGEYQTLTRVEIARQQKRRNGRFAR